MNNTIVFGGWAVSPDILKKDFGDNAHYIDVNKIMPELFDDANQLKSHWISIVLRYLPKSTTVIGWSTGAMFAYELARVHPPKKLILLSATPSFCRRDDFRFGTRPSVLDQMIAALAHDRRAVLKSFYERCGLRYDAGIAADYTTDELIRGLQFLKQADLRPLSPLPPSTEVIFYHGKDDVIIPPSASIYFHEHVGGKHNMREGGHSFFNANSGDRLHTPAQK